LPEQDYPIICTLTIKARRVDIVDMTERAFTDRRLAHWDEPGVRPSKVGPRSGWIIELWEVDPTVPRDSGGFRLIPLRTTADCQTTTLCFRARPSDRGRTSTEERFVQALEDVNLIMGMFTTLSPQIRVTPRKVAE